MADSTNPSPAEVAANAIATFKAGEMDNAIPLLRQAIEYDRERFDLQMYLGLALGKKERWQDAERAFERAAELDGGSADAAYYVGFAIAKQGRLREAHGQFVVALANDPNHAKALSAAEKTAKAAEQVTKDGSSSAVPGGLGSLDLTSLELEAAVGGGKGAARGGMPGDVAAALGDLKNKQQGAKQGAKGKKAGCGGGLVALFLLGLALALLLAL